MTKKYKFSNKCSDICHLSVFQLNIAKNVKKNKYFFSFVFLKL